jgi:predicted AAA+ superfamily ATPase
LAGRFIEFFLFPFDFKEFLKYKNIEIRDEKDCLKNKAELERLFSEYLNYGGLPEIFEITSEDAKLSYLKGILTKVVLDDIVKRFGVDNVDVLERLLNYILSNVGTVISYTNLKNKIKSLGLEVKIETVIKYINYFSKTFVTFELNKFDWKQRKIFSASKKYFSTDVGLTSLFRQSRENLSMKMENLVFLHLKRKNGRIYYGANERGREIDFVVDCEDNRYDKYQVCVELCNDNLERELGAFHISDKYLKEGKNIILTSMTNIDPGIINKYHACQYDIVKWLLGV